MKIAVTVAGSEAKESAFVVWRGFEESIRKASECGYDGVELALKDASEINGDKLRRWLEMYGMEISCISTGQVFAERGMYFTHPNPGVRRETIGVFADLIKLASEFGGKVNIGRARGFISKDTSRQMTEKRFIETMREICDIAGQYNVEMILEPVNRYEINFINSVDEGAALLEQVGSTNCGLQPDIFHMNIEDDDIGRSLMRNRKWIRYVHLADSNRYAPGMGHINFQGVFDALKMADYDGWVSVEILPGEDPDKMAQASIQYLKPLIQQYNKR